jgi:uncharacterized RDD family membrane protein YckC
METFSNIEETSAIRGSESPFIRKIPFGENIPASFGLRATAILIDYILTLVVFGLFLLLTSIFRNLLPSIANLFSIIGYLATIGFIVWNRIFLCVKEGQSLGQKLVGIKIINKDGSAPGYRTIALRHLVGYPLSFFCAGLGFLWMIIDPKQRGWHDKLAGTLIVKR